MKFSNLFDGPEAKIAAKQAEIDEEKRQLEIAKNIATRRNSLRDRLDTDTSRFDALPAVNVPVRIGVERRPVLTASPNGKIVLHEPVQHPKHPNDS